MKNLLLSLVLVLTFTGCVSPGNDPLIVHAQQTKRLYLATADSFLKLEKANRDVLWKKDHGFKHIADRVRIYTPEYIAIVDKAITDWKVAKTQPNQVALSSGITILTDVISDVTKETLKAKEMIK